MLLVYLQLPSSTNAELRSRSSKRDSQNHLAKRMYGKMALLKLGFSKEPKNELSISVRRKLCR